MLYDYDCYLSGGTVTLVILKDNILYCANVGNINASLFYSEKYYSLKFKIIELSTDHSAMTLKESSALQANVNKSYHQETSLESKLQILIFYA